MEVPPLHPRPATLELLLLQGDHRSSHIWEGQLLAQTFCTRRVDDMWGFLRDRTLHPRIVRRLQDTGFYRIVEIDRLQLDWSLIKALIKRWRLETHTFHLPIGEATVTLQDMDVMYGLPVDEHPVALMHAMIEQTGLQYMYMLQRLTGLQLPEETALVGASRLQLMTVRQHLEALHSDITDDTSELHIHRQICRASMDTQRDVAGFLPLLQAWERFLQLHPPLSPLAPGAPPPFHSLARKWVDRRGYGREYEARHNLPLCRDLLDLLEGAQFIWRPYSDELIASLPNYCSAGRIMWSSSVSLMCLDIVEHHTTERVLR
ncbi:serine/threonine-protein phosphatase 7 long form homolog [Nicotiana tomentosiformis]|uniref:serine/threonine-protein phosphatase 7 long form homolog n=1 Tax=Nicotiana tomentosiformis TaxID=4098 RepID=UPI00388CD200